MKETLRTIKYNVHFTYKMGDNTNHTYIYWFETPLSSKEEYIKEIEKVYTNIKVLSIDKIEKEETIITEIEL